MAASFELNEFPHDMHVHAFSYNDQQVITLIYITDKNFSLAYVMIFLVCVSWLGDKSDDHWLTA